ncbi:MAG: WYL domain-containing protein [Pseudomonadota bacterium]
MKVPAKPSTPVLSPKLSEPEKTPRWSQERRLRFIDFRLQWQERINRNDLKVFFGISVPQASADIALYSEQAPENIEYDRSSKTYVAKKSFQALFKSSGPDQYLAQLLAVDRGILDPDQALMGTRPPTESVQVPGRTIDRKILAGLLHAIEHTQMVHVRYQSISRNEPVWRDISPHALGTDGLRWHARAYCHLRNGFRDLVLGRILELGEVKPSKVQVDQDTEWHRMVEIVLVPGKDLTPEQRQGVEADYGMSDGRVVLKCRRAMLFYTLRTLNFDYDGNPRKGERQLIIENLEQLKPLPRPGQA